MAIISQHDATGSKPAENYPRLIRIDADIHIWTPGGEYTAPNLIAMDKVPIEDNYGQTANFLRRQTPSQYPLTSGEWNMTRICAQRANTELEHDMITGPLEKTSTFVDYKNGLVIQVPIIDEEGRIVTDEKGIIKGRDMWPMALPREGGLVEKLVVENPDLAEFFDTIYGMKDVARYPSSPLLYMDEPPFGVISILRGNWLSRHDCARCDDTDAHMTPPISAPDKVAALRGAVNEYL
jgi:hypothetical protein